MSMKCCAPSTHRRWAFLLFLPTIALIISAVYIYQAVQDVEEIASTILDGYVGLVDSLDNYDHVTYASCPDGYTVPDLSAAKEAADEVPKRLVDDIRRYLDYADFVSITPCLVNGFLLLFAVVSACIWPRWQRGFCCAKCFIGIAEFLLLFALAFTIIFTVLGLFSSTERGKEIYKENVLDQVCTPTTIDDFNRQIAEAQGDLDTYKATGFSDASCTSELQMTLDTARNQVEDYDSLCESLEKMLEKLEPLLPGSMIGLVGVILAYFFASSLCCVGGCCNGVYLEAKVNTAVRSPPATQPGMFAAP